jgi:hypothetical protein
MKHNEMRSRGLGARWGLWNAVGGLVLAAALAVIPAQSQDPPVIPQVEFGACGPMDVVFIIDTTASMGGAIQNIIDDLSTPGTGIIDTIINAAGDDSPLPPPEARLGLVVVNGFQHVTFDTTEYDCVIPSDDPYNVGDCIIVLRDLGSSTIDEVETSITNLAAGGGGGTPEITAEALRTVFETLPETPGLAGVSPAVTAPGGLDLPDGWPRLQWNPWNGTFQAGSQQVVFLVTDDVPGGSDDTFEAADATLASDMAMDYANAGIVIQPIQVATRVCDGGDEDGERVPTGVTEAMCTDGGGSVVEEFRADVTNIMQAYATQTGGTLTQVPFSGEGTALSIISIIENCGGLEEQEGRMTGGGSVFHEDDKSNGRVTHGFTLHCDGGPNRLQVNWGNGNKFHLETLTEASCFDFPELDEQNPVAGFDTIMGSGVGRLNGVSGATIEFTFVDDGEPGKKSDTAIMTINGGADLIVSGKITKGNQQAHPEN